MRRCGRLSFGCDIPATPNVLLKRQQRKLWQRIYREVFADFGRLDKLTRQYRTSLLRRNIKAYLSRKGCK